MGDGAVTCQAGKLANGISGNIAHSRGCLGVPLHNLGLEKRKRGVGLDARKGLTAPLDSWVLGFCEGGSSLGV